ncbi:MAG: PadR family transcriptional regulator [Gaiellaceae bacterium]
MQELTPTARVVLGMLGLGARTGYDIKQFADVSTRFFWGASYGQIYPELRRLEQAGLVQGEDDPAGGRKRTAYRLTKAGREAVREWLLDESPLQFDLRAEGLLKLFLGGLLEPEEVVRNLRVWRGQLQEALAHFRSELEPVARTSASGYPYVALEYGLELLEWNVDWCRRMERRLSRGARRQRSPQAEMAAPRRP